MDVRAEARRQAVHDDLDDAAEGVAVLVGLVDRARPSPCWRRGRGSGPGRRRGARRRPGSGTQARRGARRRRARRRGRRARAPTACSRKLLATRPSATRAAVSRAEARSRIGRASSKPYFCMPTRSAWPGRGRVSGGVAGQRLELDRVDRVGRHHLLPLGPLGVADLDRDRAALGLAVADAADDRDLVLLELHPGAAAVAEAAPGERVGDVGGGHPDVGGQPLEDRDQGGAVGLARGEPTQHAVSLSRPRWCAFRLRRHEIGPHVGAARRPDQRARPA